MNQRRQYPSDISPEQFAKIKPLLESARKKTRPREVDLYEVFCAVLDVLRSGCQWRMIPAGFPKWRTVYAYWQIWNAANDTESLLQQALKKNRLARPASALDARPSPVC
jgi:transposase